MDLSLAMPVMSPRLPANGKTGMGSIAGSVMSFTFLLRCNNFDHNSKMRQLCDNRLAMLTLWQSNRLETLRECFIAQLDRDRREVADPFARSVVLVQNLGMADWLEQGIAEALGVCGGVDFVQPGAFLWRCYQAVLGEDATRAAMRFDRRHLLWRIAAVLLAKRADPAFAPLAPFWQGQSDEIAALVPLAQRIADVFDQYQVYRADWLLAWARGEALRLPSGTELPWPADLAWQPLLWRALVRQTTPGQDGEGGSSSRDRFPAALCPLAEVSRVGLRTRPALHEAFCQRLRGGAETPSACFCYEDRAGDPGLASENRALGPKRVSCRFPELPSRLYVFGISSMPAQALEALLLIGQWVPSHWFLPNPSAEYWGDVQEARRAARWLERYEAPRRDRLSHEDVLPLLVTGNPLLAGLGKAGREFLDLLLEVEEKGLIAATREVFVAPLMPCGAEHDPQRVPEPDPTSERHERFTATDCCPAAPPPLLWQLQQALFDVLPLPQGEAARACVDPEDVSIQFHVAASPLREVEVLRQQLLALIADGVAPREILVLAPDVETYAPWLRAVFGTVAPGQPGYVPLRLSDRAPRGTSPTLRAIEWLFAWPRHRLTLAEAADWLEVPAVQRRLGLDREAVTWLVRQLERAGMRWGLNEAHRAALGVPGDARHTLAAALERLWLGYAIGEGACWHERTAVGGTNESEVTALAALGELLAAWQALDRHWRLPATPAQWHQRWLEARAALFDPGDEGEAQQALVRVAEAIEEWVQVCAEAGFDAPVSLAVLEETLAPVFAEPQEAQPFLGGAVTVATLMPMRAIPFRVVYLLGMNDGAFPRPRPDEPFNAMLRAGLTRPGDRRYRDEERYLFLETLMAARERLILSWVGQDIRDGSELPPSPLVAMLRDYLAAGWQRIDGKPLLEELTVVHPLQPFSVRYFDGSDARLFSFEAHWRNVHIGASPSPASAIPPATAEPGLPLVLDLQALSRLIEDPAAWWWREVWQASVRLPQEALDLEPLTPETAGLARRVSWPAVEAAQLPQAIGQWRDSGEAPAGTLRELAAEAFARGVRGAQARREALLAALTPVAARPLMLCGHALGVQDWLEELYVVSQPEALPSWVDAVVAPDTLVRCVAFLTPVRSEAAWQRRWLSAWLTHVLAAASAQPVATVLIASNAVACLPPASGEEAQVYWQTLQRVIQALQRGPLPWEAQTAIAWVEHFAKEENEANADEAARSRYEGNAFVDGRRRYCPELARFYPDYAALVQAGFREWAQAVFAPMWRAFNGQSLQGEER